MTNELNNKRLSDDELEAVSGGVTAPSVDPVVLAMQMMQQQHDTALSVAMGGAPVVASTTAHTDTSTSMGTPTITGQTQHTVAASAIFGDGSLNVTKQADPVIASGTLHLDGHLLNVTPPAGGINENSPTVQVMHFENTQGTFTKVTPVVVGVDYGSSQSGGTYNIANRQGIAFNLPSNK